VGYPTPRSLVINGGLIPRTAWYEGEVKDKEIASLDIEAPYYTTSNGEFLLFGPYRYDAADNRTACVMCNPNGSGPIPHASFFRSAFKNDNPAGGPPRPMSENGNYVFFDTAESLVPQDTNGALDVYEWEAKGTSGCELTQGCVHLISSGEDPKASFFIDSSPDGKNVFFGTHAKLVLADTDGSGDLYDARMEGGFSPPTPIPPCEGDACANPLPLPLVQAPATLTSAGSGNFARAPSPIRCSKPKKLSHGKCVRKKTKVRKSNRKGRR
jgi:hypothetical protein